MPAAASALATRGLVLVALGGLALALAVLPLRVAAFLTAGGLLGPLVLIYPAAGLALLAFAAPFGDPFAVTLDTLKLGPPSIVAIGTLLAWLGHVVLRHDEDVRVPPLVAALLPLLVLILFVLPGVPVLVAGLRELFIWLELLIVYVAASHLLRGTALRIVVASLLVAACAEALVGWYQFFARVGPPSFAIGPFLRAYGTFGQPNPFAGYLDTVLPLALGIVLGAWRVGWRSDWRMLALAAVTAGLAGPALVMSMSRGAWLGFGAAVVVMLLAAGHVGRRALVVCGFGALGLVFLGTLDLLPAAIVARLADTVESFGIFDARSVMLTDENFAVVDRMAHWQAAWEMYRANPLLGVGPGQYQIVYPEFRLPLWPDPKIHAHNFYLHTLAELGVLGAGALLIFLGSAAWHAASAVRRATGEAHGLAIGVLGVVTALAVHSVFDNVLVHGVNALFGLILGLATALIWWGEPRARSD